MERENAVGITFIIGAYILWGVLPIYWKFLDEVPAPEILAHRIIWSFVFISIVVLILKRKQLKNFFQVQMSQKKTWFALILTSLLISANWLTYIFAVNTDHIVDASLGYYINPLVSVLLGVFVLRERFNKLQTFAFILAGIGVLYMTFSIGKFPWIALILALSFGFYGLAKKLIKVDSTLGLFLETLFAVPLALIYLTFLGVQGEHSFTAGPIHIDLFLIGAGIATALPLLWFGIGAQKIPLYMLGFLQYIAPTISLIIGVTLYDEPFTKDHVVTFLCIWIAIAIFTYTNIRESIRKRRVASTVESNVKSV